VQVGGTAQVKGDLVAPRIGIEEGAEVRGAIRTGQEPKLPSTASRAAEPARTADRKPAAVKRAAPPPAAVAKKRPPAPVVPAMRRGAGKKKKARGR
jgi:hypothetical protein